jgi:hypothetical protein
MPWDNWRTPISNHDQFEELCALAAAGSLGPEDCLLLATHLEECVSCRALSGDMAEIHAKWLPERPGFEIYRDRDADFRHREEIIKELARAGARFSSIALRAGQAPASRRGGSWGSRLLASSAAAGLLVLGVGIGVAVLNWSGIVEGPPAVVLRSPEPVVVQVAQPGADALIAGLETLLQEARALHQQARLELATARLQADGLDQDNAASRDLIARLEQQLQATTTLQQSAELQLADVRARFHAAEGLVSLQDQRVQNLNKRLAEQAAQFEQERQVLSLGGKEVRDLIAARNLHIIDVYDTDTRGRTDRAFGRIFYTEGKSLIFYAYDLDGRKGGERQAFHVWGRRDGAPQDVRNLGHFKEDEGGQLRWVFTTTDAQILASIDSVFVTIEPSEYRGRRPQGRPMLNAYLGNAPNHP